MKIKPFNTTRIIVAAIYLDISIFIILLCVRAGLDKYTNVINRWAVLSLSILFLLAFIHSILIKGIWLKGDIFSREDKPFLYYSFLTLEIVAFLVNLTRFIRWKY